MVKALTFSNVFGSLAFSVAIGAMVFFSIFSPYGLRSSTTVFGREQKYRFPVSEIPKKVAILIIFTVCILSLISFGFFIYGM